MRCKRCGIQLTANNLDDCPNCGPNPMNCRASVWVRILESPAFFLARLFINGSVAIVIYFLTQSAGLAIGVFLLLMLLRILVVPF